MRPWTKYLFVAALTAGGVWAYLKNDPVPPSPGPGPGPIPIPIPVDILLAKLQAAYDADKSETTFKAGQKIQLMGIYAAMARFSSDKAIATQGDVIGAVRDLAGKMLAPGLLIEVRQAVAAEAVAVLGDDPATKLDDATRLKAKDFWGHVVETLKRVK